jgi:hypothetical protein
MLTHTSYKKNRGDRMKFAWLVAAAAMLIATATHVSAAVIYTYTGTLGSDSGNFPVWLSGKYSSSYVSNDTLYLDVDFGLPRTLTVSAWEQAVAGKLGTFPPPDLALPAPVLYTIDIFTPSAPLTAEQVRTPKEYWYNEYLQASNGTWYSVGGSDFFGSADRACCGGPGGQPIDVAGNLTSTSVLEKVNYTLLPGYVEFDWAGDIGIEDTLNIADVGKPYFLEIFASAVPEPSTWAMYILGLGTMGITLRARRRRRNAPVS